MNKRTLIEAFRRVPEETWGLTTEPGKVNPHTILKPNGATNDAQNKAFLSLGEILKDWQRINDGEHPEFQQKCPKFRIIAALSQ